LCPKCN